MELPPIENVFFIHYQRDDFNNSDEVYNLCIISNDEFFYYTGNDESLTIFQYAEKVHELQRNGKIPVHWSQNAPHYGTQHLNSRYEVLTGKKLGLEYINSINLAYHLIKKYGENYAEHKRLDNLAIMNNFLGVSIEKDDKTFPVKRAELLSKIYFNDTRNTLVINSDANRKEPENDPSALFGISVFLNDRKKYELFKYLCDNFTASNKSFTKMTKYNQIYSYLNSDSSISKTDYKKLILKLYGFEYGKSEIKGETEKHRITLSNLEKQFQELNRN